MEQAGLDLGDLHLPFQWAGECGVDTIKNMQSKERLEAK
jgi:hypothetical protein